MDLKELEAIIKLCRKLGVTNIKTDSVDLTLTAEAPASPYKRRTKKAAPSPFEQALSEAKDAASRAKIKYAAQQAGQPVTANPEGLDVNGAPDELAMLLWSAGAGDGAN